MTKTCQVQKNTLDLLTQKNIKIFTANSVHGFFVLKSNDIFSTLLLSWLDSSALINVDAPGCGTSVVQGPRGTSKNVSSWSTVVPKGFLTESAHFTSQTSHSAAS